MALYSAGDRIRASLITLEDSPSPWSLDAHITHRAAALLLGRSEAGTAD
jgi:hypothetical protein